MADKLGIKTRAYQDIESGKTKRLDESKKRVISELLEIPIESIDDSYGINIISENNGENAKIAVVMNNEHEFCKHLLNEIEFLKNEITNKNKIIEGLLSK